MSFTRWLATFLGFPLGGFLAVLVVGSVDSPFSASLAGLLAGSVIGTAQWLVLRSHGVGIRWVLHTAAAMAAGNGAAAVVTDAGTTVSDLMVTGLVVGAAVGAAQGVLLGRGRRVAAVWATVVSLAWASGWAVTANVIVDAERGYVTMGASGALFATVVTGLALRRILARTGVRAPSSAPAGPTGTAVAATR